MKKRFFILMMAVLTGSSAVDGLWRTKESDTASRNPLRWSRNPMGRVGSPT